MIFVGIATGESGGVEIVSIKTKTPKERLVNLFTQEIGGTASYWNKIPAEQLKSLHEAIKDNDDAKAALANLVKQLQDARQTNSHLNQKNFGLNQTAAKYERVADHLTKMNALLEQQKNELLRQVQKMVSCLNDYEKSEIRQAVTVICDRIGSWVR